MARFLFITWHGGGNVPPAVGIAQELKKRGHAITFAGYESQRLRFMERGFAFSLIDPLARNWMDLPPEQRLLGTINQVFACQDHLHQVPELAAREKIDAVVVDCMMYAALAAAENLNLPFAVLVHTIPGSFAPGTIYDRLMGSVNAVRAQAGRQAVSTSWEAWSNAPVICATIPDLDPSAGQVPSSFKYVGPIFEHLPPSGWHSPWSEDDPRPLVLVSFSTHSSWDETSRINRTLEALAGSQYRVLVTSGMAEMDRIIPKENAVVTPYLPHGEVLPLVKMAVIHAGHGSVTNCLAHGVPMVCLPNNYSDQPMLAAQVESIGTGLALDGDNATVEEITQAVQRVMSDPSYSAAAGRLAAEIQAMQGADRATSLLEKLS